MNLAVVTFVATYLLLIDGYYRRTFVVLFSAAFLLLVGVVTPVQAFHAIDWNVMGIFFGMLVIADLFLESRMPAVLAGRLARRTRSIGGAVIGMCILASVLSAFLENVAVVLVLAPIAIALAFQLQTRATPFLIGIALSSNLQGTATLVGDPPAMILGAFAGMSFNDFFWYLGRPGIFFAVQVGAVASFIMLWLLFRKYRAPVRDIAEELPHTYVPTLLLMGVIVALAIVSFVGHGAPYASGITVLVFALVGWLWHLTTHHDGEEDGGLIHHILHHRERLWGIPGSGDAEGNRLPSSASAPRPLSRLAQRFIPARQRLLGGHRVLRELDWETTLFLVGVFMLVGSLSVTGAIDAFSAWFTTLTGGSVVNAYVLLVVFSVALSAFIDNVPFTLAMLPVAQSVALSLHAEPFLLYAGLLIGASVGGNITPIGAAANIVAYRWIEERAKEPITFWGYVRYGLPFTIVAVGAAALFGWFAWS